MTSNEIEALLSEPAFKNQFVFSQFGGANRIWIDCTDQQVSIHLESHLDDGLKR